MSTRYSDLAEFPFGVHQCLTVCDDGDNVQLRFSGRGKDRATVPLPSQEIWVKVQTKSGDDDEPVSNSVDLTRQVKNRLTTLADRVTMPLGPDQTVVPTGDYVQSQRSYFMMGRVTLLRGGHLVVRQDNQFQGALSLLFVGTAEQMPSDITAVFRQVSVFSQAKGKGFPLFCSITGAIRYFQEKHAPASQSGEQAVSAEVTETAETAESDI